MRTPSVLVAAALAWGSTALGAAQGGRVTLDVKDVALAEVVKLLAAQGGPRLTPGPDATELPITFAVSRMAGYAAVRWLCRSARLVVVKGRSGPVIGQPAIDRAEMKEYRVARLVGTPAAAETLAAFLRRVVLGAYQNRLANDVGELEPQLEITLDGGTLKVLAPSMVQREVVVLLKAMVAAKKPLSYEELRVPYRPYELGFLGARGQQPPKFDGEVSVELADVEAAEAAWSLTRASKANFFIDPWDEGLARSRVTLSAAKLPVDVVANRVAEQLGAEQVFFDGACVFVRPARKPIYESLVVRVYNVSGSALGFSIAEEAERRAKELKLPENLPYAVDLVGEKLLAAMPGPLHRSLEQFLRLAESAERLPRFPRR